MKGCKMNTFLNIGFISYLKEFEKCYLFNISVPARTKNSSMFYANAVVFKNEYTPKLENGQKVFIKGSLALESYQDKNNQHRERLKIYAESCEVVGYSSKKEERQHSLNEGNISSTSNNANNNKKQHISDDDHIPF